MSLFKRNFEVRNSKFFIAVFIIVFSVSGGFGALKSIALAEVQVSKLDYELSQGMNNTLEKISDLMKGLQSSINIEANTAANAKTNSTFTSTNDAGEVVSKTNLSGQCVSFVKNARPELSHSWGDAKGGILSSKEKGFHTDVIPRKGAAFVRTDGGFSKYGHTGIVTSVKVAKKENGSFFYIIGTIDANRKWDGKYQLMDDTENTYITTDGAIRAETIELPFPDPGISFIHEKDTEYKNKVNKIKTIIGGLYDAGLLAQKGKAGDISKATYTDNAKFINRLILLVGSEDPKQIEEFISVIKGYREEMSRGADIGGLTTSAELILAGDTAKQVISSWKSSPEWLEKHAAIPKENKVNNIVLNNVISGKIQADNSHFGAANIFSGWQSSEQDNTLEKNTFNSSLNNSKAEQLTGLEQGANAVNTVALKSTAWKVMVGDNSSHFSVGNSFGPITAPKNGLITSLNNSNVQETLMIKKFLVPVGVKQVNVGLLANFVTNEFPEYVGSQFNDTSSIEIKTASGNVYPVTIFNKALNTSNFKPVNSLPSPMEVTGGQTGFESVSKNISVANGGALTITVKTTNVGDTAVPSATLINGLSVK